MTQTFDLTAVELDEDGNLPILLVMDETPWTDEEWEEELALYGRPDWADEDDEQKAHERYLDTEERDHQLYVIEQERETWL